MAEERLIWGSERFIDAILDDMRAAAQLFEFDMEGDLEYLKKNQPEIAKLIQQGKINIANHVDFIEVTKETLDRTDLPSGLSKAEASDRILEYITRTQELYSSTNPGQPELGVTDTQALDPEFKKIFTERFNSEKNIDEIKIVGIFASTRTTPDGPSLVYADINDIIDIVEYNRRELPSIGNSDQIIDNIKKTIYEKGYVFDTGESYNSSVAFPVSLGANGRIQIPEGNHRLRAAYEVAQETGQTIYVPIYAYPSNVKVANEKGFGGAVYKGNSKFVGEETMFNALRQLLFDAGADEYAVNDKVGDRLGQKSMYTGSNYLGSGGSGGSKVSQENLKKFFTAIGVETLTYEELPEDNVYKTGVNNLTDTPTNVVDEGIELFHGRGKGSRVPEDLHAGTYQAAVDRNAFMFGSENMYEMIYNIKNNFVDEVSEALSYIEVFDNNFSTTEYLQPEVYLPNGNVDTYDIRIDVLQDGTLDVVIGKDGEEIATIFSDSSVPYLIDDLEDGTNLYSQIDQEGLEKIIGDRELDKYFGEAGGFLDPNRSFKYKDGYELYKVTIEPSAKVVEFTENMIVVENGKSISVDPDIFVNYLESKRLGTIEEITLPDGKTITLTGTDKEKFNIIKNEMDVVGYRNQMEDVGSTSYYFLNKDVYKETLVDTETNKKFDEDVLKKFVENDPYRDLEPFEDAPVERKNLAKTFMSEVEDVTDGKPLLETKMGLGDGPLQWADDVIKPNKIFNPDALTRLETQIDTTDAVKKLSQGQEVDMQLEGNYVWNDTTEFKPSEMYSRIITNNATDEDITRFFIYLATHSETSAYARHQFKNPDAIADIIKIGIFSDLPLNEIIPMGQPYFEKRFIEQLKLKNSLIGDEIYKVLVDLVNEQGQFANLKETMRNVILEAHRDIYAANPNDYFIVWRGGPLNRFVPWQSTSKSYQSAQGVMYQMVQGGYGGGKSVDTYIVHKNNMIDLDALGLSFGNEKEIIVLTEELKSPLSKRSQTIEGRKDIRTIKDWWLMARDREDAFPKDGKQISNTFNRLTDEGQATQEFFNEVIDGMNPKYKPQKPYEQIIQLNDNRLYNFQDDYNAFIKSGGQFNQHIFTSIPTFYETQIAKMQGITNMIDKNKLIYGDLQGPRPYKILDIGGTEGAWAKAFAKNNPFVEIDVLDPNSKAKDVFNKGDMVTNAQFKHAAFTHVIEDQGRAFIEGGIKEPVFYYGFDNNNPPYNNKNRWDIVHESMAFQFISNDRADQIKYIKEFVLNNNGVLIIEEKFTDNNQAIYDSNELKKNNFKSQYYTPEQLADKKFNVLLDMEGNQVTVQEVQKILGENFNHVEQYWDSGNFKGFIASDDAKKIDDFTTGINDVGLSLTNHTFSTAPTDTDIKGQLEKKMFNNGTDSKLAGQIAEETVKQNPNFFRKAAEAINNFDPSSASVKLLGRLGVVAAPALNVLARTAPVYAPGDVLIEKTVEKVVPYLDDAAAKLGLGRIPFNKLLPTYMAYEIGVAGADLVQAALYAYDESQKKAPRESGKFQDSLTKLLLPKAYEEEAIKRSKIPGDLKAFYNTPTGKKVLEELDFGSQFMKELENEKVSKYSPGWGLTKGIFSMVGNLYKSSQNPSDYTTKYKENPASIYNAGFTGR